MVEDEGGEPVNILPLWFMGPLLFYGSSRLYWSKKPGAIPRSPREWGKGGLNLALFYEHIICSIRLYLYGACWLEEPSIS
jgi:hypothetical protein